ncbi:alpha-1-antitrypsin-like [Gastrophryne carolinensis]
MANEVFQTTVSPVKFQKMLPNTKKLETRNSRNYKRSAYHVGPITESSSLPRELRWIPSTIWRKMRVILFLGLTAAFLCTLILADHDEDHKEVDDHKHDYQKKSDHNHDHDHHKHDHQQKHHSKESLACHRLEQSNKRFAYELFQQIATDRPTENVFFSPASISTSLAFLSLGAKSKTRDQILEGIGFNFSEISVKDIHDGSHHLLEVQNAKDRMLQLNSGNGLFISQEWKILEEFLEKAKKLYQAEPISIDFKENEEAKKQINSYVEKKTNGKIVDVLSSVSKEAALVFVNYINFRGEWERPFEEKFTKEGDFHVNKNLIVKVSFMKRTGYYDVAFLDDATVVLLQYKGNASALLILPDKDKLESVQSHLQDTVKKFKKSHQKHLVAFSAPLPKSGRSFYELVPRAGQNIPDEATPGCGLPVTGDQSQQVTQFYSPKDALHNAQISIDEKGTDAAGVTVMEATPMMLPPHINCDRPFFLIIYSHQARMILKGH